MTFTHALATNNYGCAKFIVDASAANGTHTTIAAALTSASSGDTIFIRPGTYTENLTLKAGVNLTAYGSDNSLNGTGKVIISGNSTLTAAGSVTISGIQLQTNSAALLTVSGSAASIVNLINCYLNCSNATGISYSSSSSSSAINIYCCTGNLGTTGIALYSMSSAGNLVIQYSYFLNTGSSTTASSNSAGFVDFFYSTANHIFSTSSTGNFLANHSIINPGGLNTVAITTAGTGVLHQINYTNISSGSAASISVGSGTTVAANSLIIDTSATNAITGAGTLNYTGMNFNQTGTYTINTTTQNGGVLQGGRTQAPSAGYLGEHIRSAIGSGSAVSLTTGTAANVTSISLTAGIWDVSGGIEYGLSSTFVGSYGASIGTTSATVGTLGDNYFLGSVVATANTLFACNFVPAYRITLTATTTVYLVAISTITAGTINAYGRISATRVG